MWKIAAVFEDQEFNQELASLVIPIALQQFMLAVVSASDAIMLNLISQDKMSAVSLATQVTFVENLFLTAMTIGLSMLAAQYWGRKDVKAVERIFAYVLKITAAVCFVFFIASLACPRLIMGLLTNEPVLILGLWGFPRLEIAGAAIATTIARCAEVLWCAAALSKEGRLNFLCRRRL